LDGRETTDEDDHPERTGGEQQVHPRLDLVRLYVESGRDDACFVESAVELDDDFSGAVVVDDFELADVSFVVYEKERRGRGNVYVSVP
jgi:hypothetical protein